MSFLVIYTRASILSGALCIGFAPLRIYKCADKKTRRRCRCVWIMLKGSEKECEITKASATDLRWVIYSVLLLSALVGVIELHARCEYYEFRHACARIIQNFFFILMLFIFPAKQSIRNWFMKLNYSFIILYALTRTNMVNPTGL